MSSKFAIRTGIASAALAGFTLLVPCVAQTTQPDNTKVNQRDRSKAEPTADNAKEGKPDRELMRKVRHSVVSDKSLSTYAHNVKIIAQNGKVTLKGPVRSDEEKQTVEAKAVEVAGTGNVVNELTVAPKKATK